MKPIVFLKAHVKGYTRKDGTYVKPHETKAPAAKPKPPAVGAHSAKVAPPPAPPVDKKPLPAGAKPHPEPDHYGQQVMIHYPSKPTPPSTWSDPEAVATFVPGGAVPAELHGVPLSPWADHPKTDEGWEYYDGVDDDLDEPPLHVPPGMKISAGVIVEEPDGRVWLTHPTNQFGGYQASFPKGTAEPGMSLQATALKEAFEETGLKLRIVGFVGDFKRTTSVARMYRAVRVGGTPAAMGWESQAVSLCPKGKLYDLLNMATDHGLAQAIGAGDPPKKAQSGQASIF